MSFTEFPQEPKLLEGMVHQTSYKVPEPVLVFLLRTWRVYIGLFGGIYIYFMDNTLTTIVAAVVKEKKTSTTESNGNERKNKQHENIC